MPIQSVSHLILAAVLAVPQAQPSSADNVEEAKQVIAKAWAAREAIEFGRFDIRVQGYGFRPDREQTSELRAKIWFSGKNMRIEKQQFAPLIGRDADGEPSTEKYVFTPDAYYSYDNMITDRGARLMADMGSPDQESGSVNWLKMFRLYGMLPTYVSGLNQDHLDILLGKDLLAGRVRPVSHDGLEAIEIVYELTGGRTDTFTIVPSMGFSIVRTELLSVHPAKKTEPILSVITSELQQHEGGVWFPSLITFTLRVNEKVLSEEVVTFENADFGHRPDTELFTLASLRMPPGLEVHDHKAQEVLDWDGEKLVSAQTPPPSDPEAGARRFWFYTSLVTGILGAAFVAFLVLRPRRSTQNS
jgi:hypothetical protein